MSSASVPFTDVTGETFKEFNCFVLRNSGEKGVQVMEVVAVVGPVSPTSQPDLLSLSHDPVGTVVPRSKVKTCELMLSLNRSISHEASCCSGKSELNLVRNPGSERSQFPLAAVCL